MEQGEIYESQSEYALVFIYYDLGNQMEQK
jgi:hypothetical protein